MILLLSSLGKAKDCAQALEEASQEKVALCPTVEDAIEKLQTQEFSAVIVDQLLLDSGLDHDEVICKHLGSAVPVYANFAISGVARVVREFRCALDRRKREVLDARENAVQSLRQELKDTITALLLCCQMALKVPQLPEEAEGKMHDVEVLAKALSAKLTAA
ncbi:MAG TPA: hypothetical protein VEI49_01805 [Terriglobales bacterium]|nr:hypothetical protein [Terriglobales bacterium]HXY13799.1 hypothetical protein [Terriglobales bacterium]